MLPPHTTELRRVCTTALHCAQPRGEQPARHMLKTISSGRGTSSFQALLLAFFLSLLLTLAPAAAYTSGDADTIFNAYNNAFYVGGANAYYKAKHGRRPHRFLADRQRDRNGRRFL